MALTNYTPLDWLQTWRHTQGLTQQQAALLFGVHQITYAKWEVGVRQLTGSALRLAELYRDNPSLLAQERMKYYLPSHALSSKETTG